MVNGQKTGVRKPTSVCQLKDKPGPAILSREERLSFLRVCFLWTWRTLMGGAPTSRRRLGPTAALWICEERSGGGVLAWRPSH